MNEGNKEVCGAGGESEAKQASVSVIEGSVEGEELEVVKRGIVGRSTGARLGDTGSVGRCGILAEWVVKTQ